MGLRTYDGTPKARSPIAGRPSAHVRSNG